MKYFIDKYNFEINKLKKYKSITEINNLLDYSIKWSRDLKNELLRKRKINFHKNKILISKWRPFTIKNFYSEFLLNDVLTKNHYQIYGNDLTKDNPTINYSGTSAMKPFTVFCSNTISDYEFVEKNQCLPFYLYSEKDNQIENITDWGLEQFRNNYELGIKNEELKKSKKKLITHNSKLITKEDIFHYVYGVLHNPVYRKKYELNLKREFPRIPFYKDFWKWAAWGKELMELHINYETVAPYPTVETLHAKSLQKKGKQKELFAEPEKFIENLYVNDDFIPKAKLKADKENGIIVLDEITSLTGVPKQAWEYKLGIRSAIEWVLDQYKESTPSDPTIKEKFNTYKFADYKDHVIELIKRVCTVSVRTVEIMKEMETEESHNQ